MHIDTHLFLLPKHKRFALPQETEGQRVSFSECKHAAFGMAMETVPHLGGMFHASFKVKPCHFLVTEVSDFLQNMTAGESKAVDGIKRHKEPNLKRTAASSLTSTEKKIKLESTSSDPDITNEAGSCNEFECNFDWCIAKLERILGDSTFCELEKFADLSSISNRTDDCVLQFHKNLTAEHPSSLMLGNFTSRDVRRVVHRCVRYLFPQLKTITIQNSSIMVESYPPYGIFSQVIGRKTATDFVRFVLVESVEGFRKTFKITGLASKAARRELHHAISKYYGKFVEAKTVPNSEGGSDVSVRVKEKRKQNDDDSSPVLGFILKKKNTETYGAIQQMATHLKLRPHMFQYAGIKDKRAVTVQTCTVRGISLESFMQKCISLPSRLCVSDARPVQRPIRLGELQGNSFVIRLTNVHCLNQSSGYPALRQIVDDSVEKVKKHGFVNVFGPQRFGRHVIALVSSKRTQNEEDCSTSKDRSSGPTLEAPAIGLAMLNGDFKRAATLLLSPTMPNAPPRTDSSSAADEAENAKHYFQTTGDVDGTLARMPGFKAREICVLRTLRRFGTRENDAYVKALMSLTHCVRLLYVHSYCSWVWNEMATVRLRRYGRGVKEGDLAAPREGDGGTGQDTVKSKNKVFVVTAEDISSGRVTLRDVVLPVPGNQVRYPPNMEDDYRKCIGHSSDSSPESGNHDALRSTTFRIPELKINAPGAYRRLIETPANFTHRFLRFYGSKKEKGVSLGQTVRSEESTTFSPIGADSARQSGCFKEDLGLDDAMKEAEASSHAVGAMDSRVRSDEDQLLPDFSQVEDDETELQFPACDVELAFGLSPSCYATTLLCELTQGNVT